MIEISAIPYGATGALLGHIIMGMNLTIMSLMGMLAPTGVVVNDSLLLEAVRRVAGGIRGRRRSPMQVPGWNAANVF